MKRLTAIILAVALATTAGAKNDLKNFPAPMDPQTVGVKLVEHYLSQPHSHWGDIHSKYTPDLVTYPDVCTWIGSLWFAKATKNDALYKQLVERFEPIFGERSDLQAKMRPVQHNVVDYYVFGAIPLEIYRGTPERRYLDLGMKYADGQWILPEDHKNYEEEWDKKGFSWQTRLWVDDMFMITILQMEAYHCTGNMKYLDRAAEEMSLYLDTIQRPNGLFYHGTDAPFFWGRGNGWMAVGMTEMLRVLPKNNQYYSRIKDAYLLMMGTLLKYQGYDGMWKQLIDVPAAWNETSCTAMFTYAFIQGVKNGWLDKKYYGEAARKAWIRLNSYLTEDYDLRDVCAGTGTKNSFDHYMNRPRNVGDLHGQAPLIWCAYALCSGK